MISLGKNITEKDFSGYKLSGKWFHWVRIFRKMISLGTNFGKMIYLGTNFPETDFFPLHIFRNFDKSFIFALVKNFLVNSAQARTTAVTLFRCRAFAWRKVSARIWTNFASRCQTSAFQHSLSKCSKLLNEKNFFPKG
jgi:hypothetical protein